MNNATRVLELFCGIGGCAAALSDRASIVAAVDINTRALEVYSANFSHPVLAHTIESLPDKWFRQWEADLWWLSPPCQPYTRRGNRRDLNDPRAASLLALLERIRTLRPPSLVLENVPGFQGTGACQLLRKTLAASKYQIREMQLCPTQLGGVNRRRRYYLVASQQELAARKQPAPLPAKSRVADLLDASPAPQLGVDLSICERYQRALDLVDPEDPQAITACFTSAYGRSFVRSGSYLKSSCGVRRFSPREILRFLGFPDSFQLPADMPFKTAWALVGNSLSVPAVRTVLGNVQ